MLHYFYVQFGCRQLHLHQVLYSTGVQFLPSAAATPLRCPFPFEHHAASPEFQAFSNYARRKYCTERCIQLIVHFDDVFTRIGNEEIWTVVGGSQSQSVLSVNSFKNNSILVFLRIRSNKMITFPSNQQYLHLRRWWWAPYPRFCLRSLSILPCPILVVGLPLSRRKIHSYLTFFFDNRNK